MEGAVESGRKAGWLFVNAGALDRNGLPALVVPANGTGVMRAAHRPALGTASESDQLKGKMAASLALARLGIAFLWQWGHELFLLF